MFEYYENEYLKTSGQGNTWNLTFKPCSRNPNDFYSECLHTAKTIYEKSKQNYSRKNNF